MRTSRISRETTKVVTALALSPRRSSRIANTSYKQEEEEVGDDQSIEGSHDGSDTAPRKRKRDAGAQLNHIASFEYEHKTTENVSPPKKKSTSIRRQPAKRIKKESGEVVIAPPTSWEKVYSLTKAMRSPGGKAYPAVVDTMGCERLADRKMTPRQQRLQTLIALMLSSQTKDTVTAAAIANLQDNLPGGLTLESLLDVEERTLDSLICKVGFHNTKAKNIKEAAVVLRDKFDGDIPDTIEGLTSLRGVGPKMGYLTLSAAWGKTEGIGVDVHVHRITNLWGWHKTNKPEETRLMLESWLPRDKWHEINWLLVGFGQTVCTPVGRKCGDCVLAEEGLCPSSVVRRQLKKKVKEEIVDGQDGIQIKHEIKVEENEVLSVPTIGDIEDGGLPRLQSPTRT